MIAAAATLPVEFRVAARSDVTLITAMIAVRIFIVFVSSLK